MVVLRKRKRVENKKITDPQIIVDMIDQEGWPAGLEWLYSDDFGDEQLNQLIYDATQQHNILSGYWEQIKARLEELGVDVYID